jgi:hypothetical protein
MKLNYSIDEILETTKMHEEILARATEISRTYIEIFEGHKRKINVESIKIEYGMVITQNDFDWDMNDHHISTIIFPVEWLLDENVEEKIIAEKERIDKEKELIKAQNEEHKKEKEEEREMETMKKILTKYAAKKK